MDPQLLRRGGQRRERKTANVETVCECVRVGPGSSGCPTFESLCVLRCICFSLPRTESMFAGMQRKLHLNAYPQTIAWMDIQTYVALHLF